MSLGDYIRTSVVQDRRVAQALEMLGPIYGGTATGSSNAYVLTTDIPFDRLVDGECFRFYANHTNSGASTLNVSNIGAKSIKLADGSAIPSGLIASGRLYDAIYNESADYFLLLQTFGRLNFTAHFGASILNGSIAAGDTDTLAHGLGATPNGVIILRQVGGQIIETATPDSTNVYIKNPNSTGSITYRLAVIP